MIIGSRGVFTERTNVTFWPIASLARPAFISALRGKAAMPTGVSIDAIDPEQTSDAHVVHNHHIAEARCESSGLSSQATGQHVMLTNAAAVPRGWPFVCRRKVA
jgi:hypothetical protein